MKKLTVVVLIGLFVIPLYGQEQGTTSQGVYNGYWWLQTPGNQDRIPYLAGITQGICVTTNCTQLVPTGHTFVEIAGVLDIIYRAPQNDCINIAGALTLAKLIMDGSTSYAINRFTNKLRGLCYQEGR